jgi:hypothetical protein
MDNHEWRLKEIHEILEKGIWPRYEKGTIITEKEPRKMNLWRYERNVITEKVAEHIEYISPEKLVISKINFMEKNGIEILMTLFKKLKKLRYVKISGGTGRISKISLKPIKNLKRVILDLNGDYEMDERISLPNVDGLIITEKNIDIIYACKNVKLLEIYGPENIEYDRLPNLIALTMYNSPWVFKMPESLLAVYKRMRLLRLFNQKQNYVKKIMPHLGEAKALEYLQLHTCDREWDDENYTYVEDEYSIERPVDITPLRTLTNLQILLLDIVPQIRKIPTQFSDLENLVKIIIKRGYHLLKIPGRIMDNIKRNNEENTNMILEILEPEDTMACIRKEAKIYKIYMEKYCE